MYKVELTPQAQNSLARLDKDIAQRVANKIAWLSQNLKNITPEPSLMRSLVRTHKISLCVMPDVIRHPVFSWIPAFAGMTTMASSLYIRSIINDNYHL